MSEKRGDATEASVTAEVAKCTMNDKIAGGALPADVSSSSAKEVVDLKHFPFMQLPLELREMVFKELLCIPQLILLESSAHPLSASLLGYPDSLDLPTIRRQCRLFLVSKSFYKEVGHLFFGLNTFYFSDLLDTNRLLNLLPDHRRAVSSLGLCHRGLPPTNSLALLRDFPGLRRLHIDFKCRSLPDYGSVIGRLADFQPEENPDLQEINTIRGLQVLTFDFPELRRLGFNIDFFADWLLSKLYRTKEPYEPSHIASLDEKDGADKFYRSLHRERDACTIAQHEVIDNNPDSKESSTDKEELRPSCE